VTVAGNSLFDNTPQSQGPPSPYLSVTEEAPDPSETMYHVFLSVDNGATWRAIDLAGVPKVACHAAVFRRNRPFTLYIANDCGVWASDDFEKWMDVTGNMPNVLVSDLVYHDATRMLWASTYGRGIWRLPLLA
jgi:hypothetical protein